MCEQKQFVNLLCEGELKKTVEVDCIQQALPEIVSWLIVGKLEDHEHTVEVRDAVGQLTMTTEHKCNQN